MREAASTQTRGNRATEDLSSNQFTKIAHPLGRQLLVESFLMTLGPRRGESLVKLKSQVFKGEASILGNARTTDGPVASQGIKLLSVYLMISIGFLSFILVQVVNTALQNFHAFQRTATASSSRRFRIHGKVTVMPSHVPHDRAFSATVCPSHAVKGGLVAKRAAAQMGQPSPGSGSTGGRAASPRQWRP